LNNFVIENSIKSKLKSLRELGCALWYCWKAFDEEDVIEAIFVILKPKVQEILNFK
jgi:hypothetical protein